MLLLASCGGSSNNKGDGGGQTGGSGGFVGGGGGNAGSGTAAPGGSGSPGSTGGITGGGAAGAGGGASGGGGAGMGGAGGGTPSACPDPKFPVSCPPANGVPAVCWSPGTNCGTIAKCGEQFFSCTSPNAHYDCALMRCEFNSTGDGGATECGDPNFPVACPAIGEVPRLCWSSGTICSTLVRCGTEFKSCLASGYRYDCATAKCVPDTGTPPADAGGGPTPDAGGSTDSAAPADSSAADTAAPSDTAPATDATSG
jgi:hypothetical protein